MKSIKLCDSFNHSFLHLQCFFLYKSTCGIQIFSTTNTLLHRVCETSLTILLSVTLKTTILFAKLFFIFYNRCSRYFPNLKNFSNILTSNLWIFFPCNQAIVLFRLAITSFSAIDQWVPFWKETSSTSLSTLFLITFLGLLARKKIWEDFSSYSVLKNAMVSF